MPQYSVTIRKWNLEAKLPEALFRSAPPAGAQRDRHRGLRGTPAATTGGTDDTHHHGADRGRRPVLGPDRRRCGPSAQPRVGVRDVARQRQRGTTRRGSTVSRRAAARSGGPQRQRPGVGSRPRPTRATTSTRRSPPTAAPRRPSARTSTSRTARSRRNSTTTNRWGESATRERKVEGQGGYATVEGNTKTSTGREASSRPRRRPDRVRPAGRGGLGQHEVQRQLQRGRRAQPVRRLHEGRGRAVRRQGHDDAAVRLSHDRRITAAPTTRYGGCYYRPVHAITACTTTTRCPCRTTPTTASPPVGAIIDHGRRHRLHDGQGRQLQQADDEQRGQGRLPVGAAAPGRQHQDASRRARARDGVGHDLLPERQRVLPARGERRPGDVRDRDAAGRRRCSSPRCPPTSRSCS